MAEAIIQYQKHLDQVFSDEFNNSKEAVDIFLNICDLAVDCNMGVSELEVLLRKLGKFLIAFNRPRDQKILGKIYKVIEKAISEPLEIDEKSNIPCMFYGIC